MSKIKGNRRPPLLFPVLLTILVLLNDLNGKVDQIMATELDLENSLQQIANGVADLAKEIADLKVVGPGLVTQEQLDALDAKAQDIVAATKAAL